MASRRNSLRKDQSLSWKPMQPKRELSIVSVSQDNRLARLANSFSWASNWLLMMVKAIAVVFSGSKSVTAALADSAVDLLSQYVLNLAEKYMQEHSPNYPIGRSRLEALSVLASACIMTVVSVEVIQFSIQDLVDGFAGHPPKLSIDAVIYVILGLGIILKVILYFFCEWARHVLKSDILQALAEDHLNDVFSNLAAVCTASIAFYLPFLWWTDPLGAILISVAIIYRWIHIMYDQVKKITGHSAPEEFIEKIKEIASAHDKRLLVDGVRAYHFGSKYNVEVDIVLPSDMSVKSSHCIAYGLQEKFECMDDVERAFVLVDHKERGQLRHKVERDLLHSSRKTKGSSNSTTPTVSMRQAKQVKIVPSSGSSNPSTIYLTNVSTHSNSPPNTTESHQDNNTVNNENSFRSKSSAADHEIIVINSSNNSSNISPGNSINLCGSSCNTGASNNPTNNTTTNTTSNNNNRANPYIVPSPISELRTTVSGREILEDMDV